MPNAFGQWSQADVDQHNAKVSRKPVQAQCVVPAGKAVERERELHDQIDAYCRENGFLVIHSRMDMASTIAVGHPDFTILMPQRKTCLIECKKRGGKTTVEQNAKIAHARKLGYMAEVVDNFEAAKAVMVQAQIF